MQSPMRTPGWHRVVLALALSLATPRCTSSTRGPSSPREAASSAGGEARCDRDLLACCPKPSNAMTVTLCQLFAEMVDLSHLTHLPDAPYTSQMASSFDRASRDAHPGEEAWLANHDYARLTPGEPLVLLDTEGPGVLTRIWSANPSGVMRIYLDNAIEPTIEAPMRELLRGQFPPISAPFGFEAASGSDLYLPVTYQKHCKITVTSDAHKLFYQVSYRRYEDAVTIEPFTLDVLRHPQGMPASVSRALSQTNAPLSALGPNAQRFTLATDAVNSQTLAADGGGSWLRELRVQLFDPSASVLRQTMLQIWIDGEETVRVPLGDFFGSGPGAQTVNALPVQVDPTRGTFVARWPMPFRTQLRIAITQTDPRAAPVHARVELVREPHIFGPNQLIFYAQWRPPDWQASKPSHEYTLSALQGSGYYVGTLLNVTNTEATWWGEGDEKIWIDDEAFPSFFGTGTEDYFGYAWCSNQLFSTAYIGQTLADPHANYGRISLYRFHVLDPIRFDTNLHFDLEVNHWGNLGAPIEYDSVVYFYARPGTKAAPRASDPGTFRVPDLDVPVPDGVNAAPYRCGGSP